MDPLFELTFSPADDGERRAFEGVLHDFVAREADKPRTEASSVFAHYDAPSGGWRLGFETQAALKAFREYWRARAEPASAARRGRPGWGGLPA